MITLPLHLDFTHNIGHKTLLSNFFFFFFLGQFFFLIPTLLLQLPYQLKYQSY